MQNVIRVFILLGTITLFLGMAVDVQMTQAQTVPQLVKIGGTLKDQSGQALTGVVGVTFAIYKDQQGGAALWLETQNLSLDAEGNYVAMLGSGTAGGMPLDLFTSGEWRWLGVEVQAPDATEQPRVLLVSVPYALKAADADTLGGLPASAFLLNSNQVTQRVEQSGGIIAQPPGGFTANASGIGTQGNLAVWTDNAGTLGNAALFQSGGNIGLGTSSPATLLHVANNSTYTVDSTAALTVSNGTTPAMRMMFGYDSSLGKAYIQATQEGVDVQPLLFNPLGGAVGLGTSSPQATMHVAQDSAYTSDAAAGLLISNRTTPAKRMMFGYDANIDAGYLQTTQSGVNVKPFVINPAGGNVGIGKTTAAQPLDVNGNIASNGTISGNLFSGSGASLTSLNASNVSTGTLGAANGGTGLASCTTNQTLSWSGSAWACATASGGGTVTSVTASSPLSTGGTASAPVVNLTGTVAIANGGTGAVTAAAALTNLGAASLAANTFTATQTISGNVALPNTTSASSGVIMLGGNRFLHNFGTLNTFVGQNAGNFTTTGGGNNTAVGASALAANTNGNLNTATGYQALFSNTAGFENSASGVQALYANAGGSNNTATGYQALFTNNGGTGAIFYNDTGSKDIYTNTTGNDNVATGNSALYYNTVGGGNVASGTAALGSNTSGCNNTAIGYEALFSNTGTANSACATGNLNTGLGYLAGSNTQSQNGSNNTFIGANSELGNLNLTNATAIGANAVVSASNAMVLGNGVKVGIGTATPGYTLDVQGGQINVSGGLCIAGTCATSLSTGTVTGVSAGDSSITIGGTAAAPTVAVATGGVTSAKIAASTIVDSNISDTAGINPGKINGTAATLIGTNTFLATQTILSGNLALDSGEIGIGTSVPSDNLDINLGLSSAADKGITIEGSTSSAGDLGLKINNQGTGGINWYLDSTNNNSGYGGGKLAFVPGPKSTPAMTLAFLSVPLLGNVVNLGIGTANPAATLDVAGTVKINGDGIMSSAPRMTWSVFYPNNFNAGTGQVMGEFVPERAIKVTRVNTALGQSTGACSNKATIRLYDGPTLIYELPLVDAQSVYDSGSLALNVSVGDILQFQVGLIGSGGLICIPGGQPMITLQYAMQ